MIRPPFRILLPTDVFPPQSGGAGWSTHALALALMARGHAVTVIVPVAGGRGIERVEIQGVSTLRYHYQVPKLPLVKNVFRHERLWPRLAETLVAIAAPAGSGRPLVIHAQHVQVTPAAVMAGAQLRAPVLVTVRDHWPWDYFATGLHGGVLPYSHQDAASLTTDLVARLGPLSGVLAVPSVPYMLRHVQQRQAYLRQADAVVAVSRYIATRLQAIVPPQRIHVIPNMVDIESIERTLRRPPQQVAEGQRFLLFVGKLERNKGAHLLPAIFRALRQQQVPGEWSLVIAGNGSLREQIAQELAELGVAVQFLDWADHDETLRLMARCEVLLFPSTWGEPLSRVWLEAAACGATILAMPTGGIHDMIEDGVNGALEPTPVLFARRLASLMNDSVLRATLGAAARETAKTRFSTVAVAGRYEALYTELLRAHH